MYYTPFIDTFNEIRYQRLGLDLPWELKDIIGKTCLLHKNGKLYEERPFWGSTALLQANPALRQNNLCFSKLFRSHHIYQLIAFYQPNHEPSLQGSKVLQGSKIPQLQVSRVARLQISRARVLDYQGSGVPSFQCSRFQASRFQTRKGLGLIHQQRNDQRNAKQTQNTIELLQFLKNTI